MASAEVDQFFTPSRDELAAVESRRGSLNRLSLQIGFLRMTGRTLKLCQILPLSCWSIWARHRSPHPAAARMRTVRLSGTVY
jgi:hypothetical protein